MKAPSEIPGPSRYVSAMQRLLTKWILLLPVLPLSFLLLSNRGWSPQADSAVKRTSHVKTSSLIAAQHIALESIKPQRMEYPALQAETASADEQALPLSDLLTHGYTLAADGGYEAIEELFGLLDQVQDPAQREAMVGCFAAITSPLARSALLRRLLEANDPAIVLAAETGLAAIGHLGVVEDMPQLMECWNSSEFQERLRMTVSMVTNPACVRALAKMASHAILAGQPDMAGAAAYALSGINTPEADLQLVILAGMPGFPPDCSEVLEYIQSESAFPGLLAIAEGRLSAPSANVRLSATRALSNYPPDRRNAP